MQARARIAMTSFDEPPRGDDGKERLYRKKDKDKERSSYDKACTTFAIAQNRTVEPVRTILAGKILLQRGTCLTSTCQLIVSGKENFN